MARRRKNVIVKMSYFSWRIFQRNGVWQADGRSNSRDVGRHSLGSTNYDEALKNLGHLDAIKAVEFHLIEEIPQVILDSQMLPLKAGRTEYETHIKRPQVTGGIRKTSQKRYRAVLDKFEIFCAKNRFVSWQQINERTLQQYATYLESLDYAWRTIYLEINTIKQIVNWLIQQKILNQEQKIQLSLERAKGTSTYCWRPEEVSAILTHCQQDELLGWLHVVVKSLACTGLRIGELISLRWSDLDLEQERITLIDESGIAHKGAIPRTTKSGYSRTFPIHPELLPELKQLDQTSKYVFRGPRGGRLKADTVRRILIREVLVPLSEQFPSGNDEIGFKDGRLHSFRHYFCSVCANSGVPEPMVMRWLGHRSSEMVQHYYHLHDQDAKQKMAGLSFFRE